VKAADGGCRGTGVRVDAGHVSAPLAAHALVTAGAERIRPLPGQNHHADVEVLAGSRERLDQLDDGLRAERVADLRAVDRDLGDPRIGTRRELVTDVRVVGGLLPGD
jgi:hypothetical protein